MNTEKLEKLKKSLDNKFIPDNMKDKIRVEIQKLESEIKTDETITASEVKDEVKEIEKKVEKALEVADKKEEQAKAKAPARTRAKRTTTSRTKKPKVEEKPTTKKKTVFSLAKEIRKADESWDDAKLRARKMMTSQTTETKAKARTETDKLLAMVRRNKEYKKLAGTSNLSKDAQRRAMPRGKRVSTKGWKNQYGVSDGGKVYYENRANRVDVGGFKSAYLETGGGVGKMKKPTLKKGDVVFVVGRRWFDRVNGNTYHTAEVFVNDKYVGKSRMTYGYDESYIQTAKEILLDSYKLPKGMKDTSPLWQLREYGVTLNKTVSDGLKRDLETGGTIIGTAETPLARDLGISYTGLVGETGAMSSGEMFAGGGQITISEIKRRTSETSPYFFDAKTMKFFNQKMSDFKVRKLENGKYEIYAPRKDYNGKSMGVTKRIFNPETNELEFTKDFATGGGVGRGIVLDKFKGQSPNNRHYSLEMFTNPDGLDYFRLYDDTSNEILAQSYNLEEVKLYAEIFKGKRYAEDGYLTDPNFGDFQAGVYEMGGNTGLPAGTEQHFVNYYLGEGTAQGIYAKGGGVRMVGGREYPTGRNWTNEHKHIDKADSREVNYTRKKSFDDGGDVSSSDLDELWRGYASAILFAEMDYDTDEPLENNYSIYDFDKESEASAKKMLSKYYSKNKEAIKESGLDLETIGMDIWYTQGGHGAGFFDHSLDQDVEDKLTQGANEFGMPSVETYDGKVIIRGTSFADGGSIYAKGGGVSPFKNMMETNTITEKEINLIKLRMNNDKVDEFTQEAIDFIWDNSPQLTSDQNKKGIDYLRNLWKSPTGKERANNPFGYREEEALETFEYFELRGFYDAGNRYRKFYVPLYTCVGAETSFEYYISGGGINIVG